MKNSITLKLEIKSRATIDGNFGEVRTVDTDTLTEVEGGLRVDTHVTGIVEGRRVNHKTSKLYPNVDISAAISYRLRNGYVMVK